MALLVAIVAVAAVLLTAIGTNVIKLGPTGNVLPDDPVALAAFWYRFADLDPDWDYYAFVVGVVNQVETASVYPFFLNVNLTVIDGQNMVGWLPTAGDRTSQEDVALNLEDAWPTSGTLRLPAGYVQTVPGTAYMLWTVAGARGLTRQPIFTSNADFYAEFRLPENATLEAHPEALLEWDYANVLQAYSVGARGVHVVCYQVAPTGTEGNASWGACL